MSVHNSGGVGENTFTYCPHSDAKFGPAEDALDEYEYCPYCGEETENKSHRVDKTVSEVFCDNSIMSTYRFCPNCGEQVRK